eukprot:SAG25_NODE_13827_length_262_cov_0.901840_1_plen_26_part_10
MGVLPALRALHGPASGHSDQLPLQYT